MKRVSALLLLALAAAIPAAANDILIYKSTTTTPFSKYFCTRPDSVAPIPKTPVIGSYVSTEYIVLDQTDRKLQSVSYYSYSNRGQTVKEYETNGIYDMSEGVAGARAMRIIKSNVANGYFNCLSAGYFTEDFTTDYNDDGTPDFYYDTMELNLVGASKPYTVQAGMVLPQVAPSLKGQYLFSYRDEIRHPAGPIHTVELYFEGGVQTLTLDATNTKKAQTGVALIPLGGGAALTNKTLAYGVRVAQMALEALGYDSNDELPFESLVTPPKP